MSEQGIPFYRIENSIEWNDICFRSVDSIEWKIPLNRTCHWMGDQCVVKNLTILSKKSFEIWLLFCFSYVWNMIYFFIFSFFCYKCVHNIAPPYLCNMLKMYIPTRNLRSKSKLQLCTKNPNYVRLGGRAFSTHGPSFWNSLPYELRSITTITRLKVELKTYLFKNSYNV